MEEFFTSGYGLVLLSVLVLWSSVWKGIALWRAARDGSTAWYVILLLLNTAGILEIIYIFLISSQNKSETKFQK